MSGWEWFGAAWMATWVVGLAVVWWLCRREDKQETAKTAAGVQALGRVVKAISAPSTEFEADELARTDATADFYEDLWARLIDPDSPDYDALAELAHNLAPELRKSKEVPA